MSDSKVEDIDPFDLDPKQRSEFFAAVGEAVSAWQQVEIMLYRVYECLINPGKFAACNAAFYSIRGFRDKLNMTNAAALQTLRNQILLEKWEKLSKKASKKSIKRNQLVHFIVLSTTDEPNIERRIYLSPNIFDYSKISSDRFKQITLNQVKGRTKSFRLLAGDLYRFAVELRTFLAPQ